jgi:hypothetical protein
VRTRITLNLLRPTLYTSVAFLLPWSPQLGAQQASLSPTAAQDENQTPAASAALSPICTDRPSKSNYACTVDTGHFQYESDLVNGSWLQQDGTNTTNWLILNPTFKYGVADNLDVEANIAALEIVHTKSIGAADSTVVGVSDLYLRLKYEFLNVPNSVQAAVIPYLKAPTARSGIGEGQVDGGVLFPVNWEPNSTLTLTLMPEMDVEPNSSGAGQHLNTSDVLTLAFNLPRRVTFYLELWADWDLDPARTIRQRSADLAVALGLSDYLQVDVGVNLGLNAATPQAQAYVGLSQKF